MQMLYPKTITFSLGILLACPVLVFAQQTADIGFVSVGRGASLIADINEYEMTGASVPFGTAVDEVADAFIGSAINGEPPKGIDPLNIDLFSSDDFYQDRDLWSDPRYFRCNSPSAIESMWGGNGSELVGDNPPATAPWGFCDRDYPREAIVSPYEFGTARAHFEALKKETEVRGGPTKHNYGTVPGEWTGIYMHPGRTPNNQYWYRMRHVQTSTVISLLTDEYQQRMVQEAYHHGNTNVAQWPSQYCWPEGFMRRWHAAALWELHLMVTPNMVQILGGVARNFITNVHIGREFNLDGPVPRLGADVPRWYGETIGFWDEDVLITWTSNIQGWKAHGAPEFSSKLQTIEVYTPNHDAQGNFLGLNHEAIFYDPEALIEPVRIIRNYVKQDEFENEGADPYVFIECVQSIFPSNGVATPASPGAVIEYQVPDMYGRPWAELWENYFEQDMQRPQEDDIFSFD